MFYDWLKVTQDHPNPLPIIGDTVLEVIQDGELVKTMTPAYKHGGSYSTTIVIRCNGNRLTVDGNPSKFNRLDNLIGYSSLDQCMELYNGILEQMGLPKFTKCTKVYQRMGEDGKRVQTFSDGATFQRIDLTSNVCTGGYARDYLKGLSTLRYRYATPRLHTNGCTVDWLSAAGKARMIYPKAYDKANEVRMHALKKAKSSKHFKPEDVEYLTKLVDYLEENGVIRMEQELHSEFLRREKYCYWGLFDESDLRDVHQQFVNIDEKLQVEALDMASISEKLISEGIVESTKAANTTASYVFMWMCGQRMDLSNRNVQRHRARLRKIGIDIAAEYDQSRFSPVYVEKAKRVEVTPLHMPDWYRKPQPQQTLRVA